MKKFESADETRKLTFEELCDVYLKEGGKHVNADNVAILTTLLDANAKLDSIADALWSLNNIRLHELRAKGVDIEALLPNDNTEECTKRITSLPSQQ